MSDNNEVSKRLSRLVTLSTGSITFINESLLTMQGFCALSAEKTVDLGQLEDADDHDEVVPREVGPREEEQEEKDKEKHEEQYLPDWALEAANSPLISPQLPDDVPGFWRFKASSHNLLYVQAPGYKTFMDQIGCDASDDEEDLDTM
jgi:hypothetical protein